MFKFATIAMMLIGIPQLAQAQSGTQVLTGATIPLDRDNLTVNYDFLTHVLGFTVCDNNQGYSFVVAGLSAIDHADVEAHELKHKEQIARFPNCEAFDKFVSDPRHNLEIEAEAYATGLCVSVAMGSDKISLARNYAQRLSRWIVGDLSASMVAWELINKYTKC